MFLWFSSLSYFEKIAGMGQTDGWTGYNSAAPLPGGPHKTVVVWW